MRDRKNRGFTLAELLAVVAILVILFGVIAVNVAARQRSMTRLEFDAIAKEIFIAAQNHLIAAESQGYLGLDKQLESGTPALSLFGKPGSLPGEDEAFYIRSSDGTAIWPLILPDYAVDATVQGGSYIIRYQRHPARVLDVFYSNPAKTSLLTIKGTTFTDSDFGVLMSNHRDVGGMDSKPNREKYPSGNGAKVIGWYGGGDSVPQGEPIDAPIVEIHNEEQLYVKIKNRSAYTGSKLIIIVEGVSSAAQKYFGLAELEDSVLMDDITGQGHFADIFGTAFQPGEDLNVYAVAFSVNSFTNIAKSPTQVTNSLFADPAPSGAASAANYSDFTNSAACKAAIANFRHLENLDRAVSRLSTNFTVSTAVQISDMDWTANWTDSAGVTNNWSSCQIDLQSGTAPSPGHFHPVDPGNALSYNGQKHSIKGVTINTTSDAGLFATLATNSEVNDLELIDFTVTASSGDAGALIGTADGVTVSNVLARNSKEKDSKTATTVTASSGAAGGLIGSMTNGGSVTNSAAALIVSGGSAGGLIGSMTGGRVTGSYSGGHTDGNGRYSTTDCNVTGTTAGGLIGTSSATITNCYSTCSASGTSAAGGLIGNSGGSAVSSCYATGLVEAPTGSAGALVGSGTVTDNGDNKYFWIINQDQAWMEPFIEQYKNDPAGAETGAAGMTGATDVTASMDAYNSVFPAQPYESDPARPYDAKLIASYQGEYPMLSIAGLGGSVASGDYVAAHYGDWPMPETLVINT